MWLRSKSSILQVWILFLLVSGTLAFTAKMTVDDKSVKDIVKDVDECQNTDSPPCSQQCKNTPGSYLCLCVDGYSLDADGYTCNSRIQPELIYGTRGAISGLNLRTNATLDWFPEVKGLRDLASHGEHLFLSENAPSKIYKNSYMFTTVQEVFKDSFDFKEASNINYDSYARLLYVLDTKQKVLVACQESKGCTVVLTKEQLGKNPTNMVLNAKNGVMYWATYDHNSVIRSSGMDGKELRPLVNQSIGHLTAMTIDLTTDQIYWYDFDHKTVERIQADGTGKKIVLVGVKISKSCLTISENEIIWVEQKDWTIRAANKFNGHNERTILPKFAAVGIVSLHIRSTEVGTDLSCIMKGCSSLCLRGRKGTNSCACPIGYHLASDVNSACEFTITGNPRFLASAGDIKVIRPAENSHKSIAVKEAANIGQVVWLPNSGGILFSNRNRDGTSEINILQNVNLNEGTYGKLVKVLRGLGTVESMAVDEDHKLFVFLEVYQDSIDRESNIVVASLDGKFHKSIVDYSVGEVLAFAMDCGELYVSTQNPGEILKCEVTDYDTSCKNIYSVKVSQPIKLVLEGDYLYWADSSTREIARITRKGKNRQTLVRTKDSPLTLAVSNSVIFWTEQYSRSMHFRTSQVESELQLGKDFGRNLALVVRSNSTHADACSVNNGGCSQICWGSNGVCLCDEDYELDLDDEKTCTKVMDCDGLECKDGKCEPDGEFCDGHEDCFDGSDEEHCDENSLPAKCTENQFQCNNKQCIPSSYRCDGSSDCDDDSDEKDCPCPDGQLQCKSKGSRTTQCLQKFDLCDGVNDCEDGSDELNCKFACDDTQYQCRGENNCILRSEVCDGFDDCKLHKDDEANCRASCDGFPCNNGTCLSRDMKCDGKPDCFDQEDERFCHGFFKCDSKLEFECSNSQCISSYLKCDGTPNCQDGSDEVNCPFKATPKKCAGFQCDSGQCIDTESVCDGFEDCTDGMDEQFCNNTCASMSCAQDCKMSNGRPVCVCKPGYKMLRMRCRDIDECVERNGNCTHICENTLGSYKCKCPPGFQWAPAKQICQVNGPRATMYISLPGGIAQLTENGRNRAMVVSSPHTPTHLDVNAHTGQVYWTSWSNQGGMDIHVSTGAGVKKAVKLVEVFYPIKAFAIDWITGNLFYSVSPTNTNTSIHVINTANRYQKTLFNTRNSISHLALHPPSALMYWLSEEHIMRSSMTGYFQTKLFKAEGRPGSLAIDFAADRLYWHSGHSIETVKLDGSGFFTLAINLPAIYSLDVFEGVVYMNDDQGVSKVTAAKPVPESYSSLQTTYIKLGQKMKQPLLGNSQTALDARSSLCSSCDYLCVLSNVLNIVHGACSCPDYYMEINGACRAPGFKPSTTVKTTTSITPTTNAPTTTESPCASHPCLNGGTCRNAMGHAYCKCPIGYAGLQCEKVLKVTATDPPPKESTTTTSYWWVAIVVLIILGIAASVCFIKCRRGRTPHTTIKYSVGTDDDFAPEDPSDYTITNPVYKDQPQELPSGDGPSWKKALIRSLALTKNQDPVDMTRVDMTDDLFSFQDTSKTNLITT